MSMKLPKWLRRKPSTVTIIINNPVPERAADSVAKAVRREGLGNV